MVYERGDIVMVYFDLPKTDNTKPHPAIVISNQDVYDVDDSFICVMMTSSQHIDKFSFEITDEMLQMPNKKGFSQARCHLISYIEEKHFCNARPINQLKEHSVNRLVTRINEVSFSVEEY